MLKLLLRSRELIEIVPFHLNLIYHKFWFTMNPSLVAKIKLKDEFSCVKRVMQRYDWMRVEADKSDGRTVFHFNVAFYWIPPHPMYRSLTTCNFQTHVQLKCFIRIDLLPLVNKNIWKLHFVQNPRKNSLSTHKKSVDDFKSSIWFILIEYTELPILLSFWIIYNVIRMSFPLECF